MEIEKIIFLVKSSKLEIKNYLENDIIFVKREIKSRVEEIYKTFYF
jgi:hypothetical protein